MSRRVVVVGGGLAGITAALDCAEAGLSVTLLEAHRWLGGLTHSFRRSTAAGEIEVDNGQHVFLRCCAAYRGLLDRLGVTGDVALQQRLRIPVRSAHGRGAWLRRTALPAPLHLAGSLSRYHFLTPLERARFATAALALRRVDPNDPATDRQSFGAWLREHGQTERAVRALWELVGIATLNARADDAALSLAATVFQEGLLTDVAAADIGWSRVPLGRLHGNAAARRLHAAGVTVRTGVTARAVRAGSACWLVHTDGTTEQAEAVVLAVPPTATERLLPSGALDLPAGWPAELGASPILNLHVLLDRKVLDQPFLAGVDTPLQWIFDRTGASGLEHGQYLAVSLSAADDLIGMPTPRLRERMLPELTRLLPAARSARVLDFFVTREREATFRPAPGTAALRPAATAGPPGLLLAGAWTATGWPATMEGAVRSGHAAASAIVGGQTQYSPEIGNEVVA